MEPTTFRMYFADREGNRVLVTPWVMLQNEGQLQELTKQQLEFPHYRAVADDAVAFYRQAGPTSAVLLYEIDTHRPEGVQMVGSFWLEGSLCRLGMS